MIDSVLYCLSSLPLNWAALIRTMPRSTDGSECSSPEPDFLCPNGFEDVAEDSVLLHFSRQNSGDFDSSRRMVRQNSEDLSLVKRKRSENSESKSDCDGSEPNKCEDIVGCDDEISDASSTSSKRSKKQHRGKEVKPNNSEGVIDLDCVSSPEESHHFNESISLSDDELVVMPLPSNNDEDINSEKTIRVLWQEKKVHNFKIRKKIMEIFTHFSNLEGVPEERINITLRGVDVNPNDTPHSLKIGLTFLEGGLIDEIKVTSGDSKTISAPVKDHNSLELKIQQKGVKEKLLALIGKNESMKVLISKLAEDFKVSANNIKLYFDGEAVTHSDTPVTLELEGDI